MNFNFQNKITIALFLIAFQFSFAQKKDENIGSEVVNVVKPYTPTISNAFKVPESAVLEEEGNAKKETVKYAIFSFPVASTFTPSKGKAEGVEKTKKAHLYNNYATLGIGNYGTLNAELFVNQELGNNDYVGGMFRHLSSQGGIKGVELDNTYFNTAVDLTYGIKDSDLSWNVDLGYQNQLYNWYGLPADFGSTLSPVDRSTLIGSIKPEHSYNTISLGSRINFNEGVFDNANFKFNHFTDSYGSSENRFYVKPSLRLEIMDELIKTNLIVDYVGGNFSKNKDGSNLEVIKYGYTNFGISPSFVMQQDDWTLNLGASVFYSIDNQNSNNKLFVYPQVNASLKVVGDLMIFYTGAEGNLQQNTYMDFVNGNPFLTPTMENANAPGFIRPTDQQFDIFAGLKGKLTNNVSYNIKGSYVNVRNKALYKSNDYTESSTNENYGFGNGMQVVYDDMRTLSFSGDLKASFSEDVTFGINGTFSKFTNDFQQEAWNLPQVKLNSTIDFNVTEQWFAGAAVFFVGERKDTQINSIFVTNAAPITLDSYFDVNAHVGYKYNEQLTAFIRANNITNQAYQTWLNYPVQGFQIVVGANYKFDF